MGSAYSKFMIVGKARTGTSYLQTLLGSHSQIISKGEIFHLLAKKKEDLHKIVSNPVQHLEKNVYKSHGELIRAVGFKGLYEQLGRDNFFLGNMKTIHLSSSVKKRRQAFMRYRDNNININEAMERLDEALMHLINDYNIKIIHIKRKNKFHTFLSEQLANISDKWKSTDGHYISAPLNIDITDCTRFFEGVTTMENRYDALFKDHDMLQVTYEDLTQNTDETSIRIQSFLGVDVKELSSPLRKQNRRAASDVVLNYHELKSKFEYTDWSKYFED